MSSVLFWQFDMINGQNKICSCFYKLKIPALHAMWTSRAPAKLLVPSPLRAGHHNTSLLFTGWAQFNAKCWQLCCTHRNWKKKGKNNGTGGGAGPLYFKFKPFLSFRDAEEWVERESAKLGNDPEKLEELFISLSEEAVKMRQKHLENSLVNAGM